MRTLLISLILFCSLTQFAIADGEQTTDPATIKFEVHETLKDCGDHKAVYSCFVPSVCTEQGTARKPLTQGGVENVKKESKIFSDCPAIIRFHQFTDKWGHVSIQSLQYTSEIKSIKFTQERTTAPLRISNDFTCYLDETDPDKKKHKQRGKYFKNPKYEEDLDQEQATAEKLGCTFTVKAKERAQLFEGIHEDIVKFEVVNGAGETKATTANFELKIEDLPKCDPYKIEFNDEDGKHLKMYAKIQHTPGAYFCANPDYHIEYREEVPPDEEKPLYKSTEIKCKSRKYNIGGTDLPPDSTIDARCAAEAKYFCDYDVKTNGVNGPFRKPPNKAVGAASALECKSPNTYLVIVEATNTTLVQPKFECLYLGGSEPVWTVSENELSVTLTKDGPLVYCTNKLECKFRIADSAVSKGALGPDNRPICQKDGTLYVSDIVVKDMRCEETTGQRKYIVDGGEHVIDEQTKFECKYPPVSNEQKNKENIESIASRAVGISIGFVLIIGLIVAGCFIWTCMRVRRERKKYEALNRAAWMKYCASPDEKEKEKLRIQQEKEMEEERNKNKKNPKDKKDKEKPQSSGGGEPAQYWSWNSMIMFLQHRSMSNLLKDDAPGSADMEIFQSTYSIKMPLRKDKKELEKLLTTYAPKEITKTLISIPTTAIIGTCPKAYGAALVEGEKIRAEKRVAANTTINAKAKK